jgi:hypothetical protein
MLLHELYKHKSAALIEILWSQGKVYVPFKVEHACLCVSCLQALEEECFSQSASKTVYLGKLAHTRKAAQNYTSPADILDLTAKGGSQVTPAVFRSGDASAPDNIRRSQSHVHSVEPYNREVAEQLLDECTVIEEHLKRSAMGLGQREEDAIIGSLQAMQSSAVSAAMLKGTQLGHRVRILSKSSNSRVAAHAKAVIATWKALICED